MMKIDKALMDNKLAFVLAFSIMVVGLSTAGVISYTATKEPTSNISYSVPENLDLEEMAKFTSTDKARATQIFLTNSEVQRMINGKPYELTAIGVGTDDLSAEPPKFYITFNISLDEKVISGAVDLQTRTVMKLREDPVTILG